MGYTKGDAANLAVRAFLDIVSRKVAGRIDAQYRERCIAFFDGCDALTGEPLGEVIHREHLVGANKDQLGLSVPGNIVFVNGNTNAMKHGKTLDEFFGFYPEHSGQKAKIEAWMAANGYNPETAQHLAPAAIELYRLTQDLISGFAAAVSSAMHDLEDRKAATPGMRTVPSTSIVRVGSPDKPYVKFDPLDEDQFLRRMKQTRRVRITALNENGDILPGWPKIWRTKGADSTRSLRNILWSRADLRLVTRLEDGICGVELKVVED